MSGSLIDVYEIGKIGRTGLDLSKVGVIIPAYNEEKTIVKTLGEVAGAGIPWQNIYAVDDGSTDKTPDFLAYYEYKREIKALYHKKNKGKEGGVKTGATAASKNENLDAIVFIDANQINFRDSLDLIWLVQNGYDYVFGERDKSQMPWTRGMATLEAMVPWFLANYNFKDPLCGLCVISRDAAAWLAPKLDKNGRFLLEPHIKKEAVLYAKKKKKPLAVVRGILCPYGDKSAMKMPNIVENAIFGDWATPATLKCYEMNYALGKTADVFCKGGHEIYNYAFFPLLKAGCKAFSKTKEISRDFFAVLREASVQ